jgi:site-specific DNA-cytosine methylase
MHGESPAYYLEWDKEKAAGLRELMKAGVITDGEIDTRDIREVEPADLVGFRRVHLFAGIGVWDYALTRAGWRDHDGRSVWTVSCPCPPFSVAGRKKTCPACDADDLVSHVGRTGFFVCVLCSHEWLADERHLFPEVWRLQRDARPDCLFGEQVASASGRTWFASVRAAMEILGYAVRGFDLCSAGFGGFDIRQRMFFVADTGCHEPVRRCGFPDAVGAAPTASGAGQGTGPDGFRPVDDPTDGRTSKQPAELDNSAGSRCDSTRKGPEAKAWNETRLCRPECGRTDDGVAQGNAVKPRLEGHSGHGKDGDESGRLDTQPARPASETSESDLAVGLADSKVIGRRQRDQNTGGAGKGARTPPERPRSTDGCNDGVGLADAISKGRPRGDRPQESGVRDAVVGRSSFDIGEPVWIYCIDGKYRAAERFSPESLPFPLDPETARNLGLVLYEGEPVYFPLIESGKTKNKNLRLRGYGDAINAEVATVFIKSVMETLVDGN